MNYMLFVKGFASCQEDKNFNKPDFFAVLMSYVPCAQFLHLILQDGCLLIFGGVIQIDDERTNELQKMWLCVPSLVTLSWCAITDSVNTDTLLHNKHSVIQLGVPSYLVDSLL